MISWSRNKDIVKAPHLLALWVSNFKIQIQILYCINHESVQGSRSLSLCAAKPPVREPCRTQSDNNAEKVLNRFHLHVFMYRGFIRSWWTSHKKIINYKLCQHWAAISLFTTFSRPYCCDFYISSFPEKPQTLRPSHNPLLFVTCRRGTSNLIRLITNRKLPWQWYYWCHEKKRQCFYPPLSHSCRKLWAGGPVYYVE